MSVSAATLRDAIIAKFPGDWVWNPSDPNYTWLDGMCTGFVSMWTAAVLSPGLGPPPPGSYPHVHTLTLVPATMLAAVPVYTAEAQAFALNLCTVVATQLMTTTMVVMDGTVIGHDHLPFTLPSASGLKAAIISGGGATGVGIDPWADGFANGLIEHLTASAGMTPSTTGAGHLHNLT
ncbi:hypothetical protein LCGC14_0734460 [marine sediment metagenome]|uniref:Uncharacterized protein n=1 Tax=marine sediment metagenome TaxID=412755 RepID=A0A0F9QTL4_9ZZZZ